MWENLTEGGEEQPCGRVSSHSCGSPDGRRMAYFADMAEIKAKKAELKRVVKELVKMMDEEK